MCRSVSFTLMIWVRFMTLEIVLGKVGVDVLLRGSLVCGQSSQLGPTA